LLEYVLTKAQEDSEIAEVYLHVQTNNEQAKQFYLRHGFDQMEIIKDYYKKIEPADCFLFRKVLRPSLIPSSTEGEATNKTTTSHNSVDTESG
jgi:ribosomal protein S18 acetylase RimI-like enzyme